MRIPEHIMDSVQLLDRACFEKMRDKEFRPHYDLMGLKYLRDKARNERDMRELYRGRAPYELLQNADDAGATKVAFILSEDGLAFAHDGKWFTVENFRSLADGWSDKDPNQCIGHKGLGFRSVLDITPAPYILQVGAEGFFAVKFTWALNNGHIQETLQRDPPLRAHYEKWTQYGQQACPIMAIPGLARKHNLDTGAFIFDRVSSGKYGGRFTTMFWFPAEDPDIDRKVLSELSPIPITADESGLQTMVDFLRDEVSVLLPFLASVETVAIYRHDQLVGLASLLRTKEQEAGEVAVQTEINGRTHSETFFQMRFAFPIPPQVRNQPDTPKAVKATEKAKVVLSVQLENGQPVHKNGARFHVYFPTGEETGVGFVVHGDFYVKPDRTRLMDSNYNDWLLRQTAKATANEFLTQFLKRYEPLYVFDALSPAEYQATEAAKNLVSLFSEELKKRRAPFIPTALGLLSPTEVVLPPSIDKEGFWEAHFSGVVSGVLSGKKALLSPEVDNEQTRSFLELADVQLLDNEAILPLIETASRSIKPPSWWYECYAYLANESELSSLDRSFFSGYELIPTADSEIIPVPDENSTPIVCLPPPGRMSALHPPDIFTSVFVFLDFEMAELLGESEDSVRNWVLDRFGIARFEATDLLPRTIRSITPQLFNGEVHISAAGLRQAWLFIKNVIDSSRSPIYSSSFWQDLGRFPLPLDTGIPEEGPLSPENLAPAFLTYWPDSFMEGDRSLAGIENLRRVDERFLNELISESRKPQRDWIESLLHVGVSAVPKVLKYKRLAAKAEDLPFVPAAPSEIEIQRFAGERQGDENSAVIQILKEEDLWKTLSESAVLCNHAASKVMQTLTVVEGTSLCTQAAQQEYEERDERWHQRLWALVRELELSLAETELEEDTVYCRGGSWGGHSISLEPYFQRQLDHYRWLPSSQGPASRSECFVRRSSRRLISSGRSGEELGDRLLPYVVVSNVEDVAKLQRLGVEELEDPASASSATLVRALALLGERLSTEWGQEEILQVPGRWRFVRGAIQEIYRSLNQRDETLEFPPDIRFATRSSQGIDLRERPLYYAEPGSTVEQAFLDILPLLDADRPYPRLFEQIEVTRLVPGETVQEEFLAEADSRPASRLQEEIAEKLSPYLLAVAIAKSDRSYEHETIVRRVGKRFEVRAADHLTVSYSLVDDPTTGRTIKFPKFYLQRRILPGPGAIEEAYYTLYVAGKASITLDSPELDADALGAALAPVFFDGGREELASLFPRITSRYYHHKGDPAEMREFLYYQLGISPDAQELAKAMISGETLESSLPPPPPSVKIVHSHDAGKGESTDEREGREVRLQKHRDEIAEKTAEFVRELVLPQKEPIPSPTTSVSPRGAPKRYRRITPEQQERGERGEEEIKRRLEQFGSWEGFKLISDKRKDGCGYDFLCDLEGREVKMEVKTFTPNGQIFMTSTELQEAGSSKDNYYLIGVLDDGCPEHEWQTFSLQNPMNVLLTEGEFDIEPTLRVPATKVFGLEGEE